MKYARLLSRDEPAPQKPPALRVAPWRARRAWRIASPRRNATDSIWSDNALRGRIEQTVVFWGLTPLLGEGSARIFFAKPLRA
jgi:hypothetical protein